MDNYARSLRDRKGAAWNAYTELVEGAAAENRDLTAEEVEQRDRIEADLDAIAAEEKRHADRVASIDFADSIRAQTAPVLEAAASRRESRSENDVLREMITRGSEFALETRALGNTPDGGTALTSRFSGLFVDYERTFNPMMGIATVINTDDNTPIEIFQKSADPAYGGTVTAEAGGIVAADPTLGKVTLQTYKLASITLVSSELWRSNVIDLADVIASGAARELGIDAGAWFTTGTGSDQPNGFVTAAATATATKAAPGTAESFFSAGDLISLYFSIAAPYRARGTWQFESGGLAKVRRLVDDQGNLLYNPMGDGINGSISGTLMGRPVVENPAMASPASAVVGAAFGDFKAYHIRRLPLRVDVSTDFKFQNDQIAIRSILEVDGDIPDTAAIKVLKCADS